MAIRRDSKSGHPGLIGLALLVGALLLLAAVVLPWIVAHRSDCGMICHLGSVGGRKLDCVAVDGTHFDRYKCLVFDSSVNTRVNFSSGQILLDGQQVRFPPGQNAGWLRPDGQIRFTAVAPKDVTANSSGSSKIYYILGKVPKLKRFPSGVPRTDVVEQKLLSL